MVFPTLGVHYSPHFLKFIANKMVSKHQKIGMNEWTQFDS